MTNRNRETRSHLLSVALILLLVCCCPALADTDPSSFGFGSSDGLNFQGYTRLKPSDYLFAPNPEMRNDLFENLKPVEASVNLGIGADCGRLNVEGTLRSTFGKVLGGDYFKGLAQDILASAPMLTACYLSPTWCSILKHTQLSANFLTQTRLSQCQIIDKYTDSRVEDYQRERQSCIHKAIADNGGDMEAAMNSCQGNVFSVKPGTWAGSTKDDPHAPNKLIADSVRWAGFDGPDADKYTGLIQSFVGDTVLAQGSVSIDYGPRAHPYSPRSYLISMEQQSYQAFCKQLLPAIAAQSEGNGKYVKDADIEDMLKQLPTSSNEDEGPFLTPDIVRNLAYLPSERRDRVCLKLSQTMALQSFIRDMNRSIDILATTAQNPNLPPNRKLELENKRNELKDQLDITLRLHNEESEPVGKVMQYIDQEGLTAQDESTRDRLSAELGSRNQSNHAYRMNDCADGVFCQTAPTERR